jgi:hypothetical protein
MRFQYKQEWPVAAIFINGSEINEQSLQITFQGCFLPSFDSFGKVVSEKKIFLNRPIRKKNCLWFHCACDLGSPYLVHTFVIVNRCQQSMCHMTFLAHLAKGNVSFCHHLASVVLFINGSELNEQLLQITFQGCFLPSFDSFGKVVSEVNNFFNSCRFQLNIYIF